MKTLIYAIGALALATSTATAEAMRSHPSSNHALSASYGAAVMPGQDGSSNVTGEVRRASTQTSFPAPQSVEQAVRWDANKNNG